MPALEIQAPNFCTNAPDGLPWPKGYFDRPVKQTLEAAIAIHGVRPKEYFKGWPSYTPEEMDLPGFKSLPPPESAEQCAAWRRECDEWGEKQLQALSAGE